MEEGSAVSVGSFPARRETVAGHRLWSDLIRDPGALCGALVILAVVLGACLAPVLAPYDPNLTNPSISLLPPAWEPGGALSHPLGTDPVGRDMLSRLIFGSRVSILVGCVVVALAASLGVLLGLVAGFYGGVVDDVVMRIVDVQLGFPFILLAITLMSVLGSGLINLIVVLVIGGWVGYARLIRGQVIAVKRLPYVEAARAIGAGDARIMVVHIMPNVISSAIVLATLQVAVVIIAEAGLTFLGLGVDPTIPSWGGMISDGRTYVYTAWWVVTFPGLAIMLTVLAVNLLGDWLRDRLDPHLRVESHV